MMDELDQINMCTLYSPKITIDGDSIEVEDITVSSSIKSVVPRRVHMSFSSCSSRSTMAETGAPDADELSKPSTRADGSNPQLRNASNLTEQSPFAEVIDIDDDEVEFEKEYTSFPVNAIQDSDDNSMYDEVSDITMHSFDTNHDDMLDFSQRLMPKQTPRRRQGWMKVEQDKLKAASPTPGRYHRPVDSLLAQEAVY